jgi:hypothetical protein
MGLPAIRIENNYLAIKTISKNDFLAEFGQNANTAAPQRKVYENTHSSYDIHSPCESAAFGTG